MLSTAGVVGAGGQEPLLARTVGRVRRLFFTGGEYVHRGDVLAKLYNYTFVVAPRDGFLGPCEIAAGQYLTPTTQVTTISRRHLLVVVCPPGNTRPARVRVGDSVSVWVATRPTRVASGSLAALDLSELPGTWTVLLKPGAPFRIGEQAIVRRRLPPPLAAVVSVEVNQGPDPK
ncbi:hypothetical protein [Hymenobacter arizonensis]|uniref:hypothetical protein n=1 Tax=Hymenobacter arizonensis TaxID=1227077 RepID=UPI0011602130|nr:hypothetical protein [Hymenobacter arizonensis]